MGQGYYCDKCRRTMAAINFYKSNNLEKYPNDGVLKECKKCITLHVDNWNPETFLWILEEIDVPYVEDKWNEILKKHGQDPSKVTGTTILGRYLAQMKLNQFLKYRWADTEKLAEERKEKKKEALRNAGIAEEELDSHISDGFDLERPAGYVTDSEKYAMQAEASIATSTGSSSMSIGIEEDIFEKELTEEDRKALLMKWGNYRASEWVQLETLWNDMMNSFDIQTASHKDNLKLLCKASLKANQLLDIGDIDGAQKASKMYDTLLKSGKFSALQNKESGGEYVDSIGELVVLCEKQGFIPTFYQGDPKDKVDQTIEDLKKYTHSLVTEEAGLGNMIESALKSLKEEAEKGDADDEVENIDDLDVYDELNKFMEEELTADDDYYDAELSGEDYGIE